MSQKNNTSHLSYLGKHRRVMKKMNMLKETASVLQGRLLNLYPTIIYGSHVNFTKVKEVFDNSALGGIDGEQAGGLFVAMMGVLVFGYIAVWALKSVLHMTQQLIVFAIGWVIMMCIWQCISTAFTQTAVLDDPESSQAPVFVFQQVFETITGVVK